MISVAYWVLFGLAFFGAATAMKLIEVRPARDPLPRRLLILSAVCCVGVFCLLVLRFCNTG